MEKKKILFLCTGNSCRSQMAEGFGREYGGDAWEVFSAGTHPKGIHPLARLVMEERGIDISIQTSNSMTREEMEEMDIIVTLCGDARESCPILPGKAETIHWPIEDPAKALGDEEEVLFMFQKIRDEIGERVKHLLLEK